VADDSIQPVDSVNSSSNAGSTAASHAGTQTRDTGYTADSTSKTGTESGSITPVKESSPQDSVTFSKELQDEKASSSGSTSAAQKQKDAPQPDIVTGGSSQSDDNRAGNSGGTRESSKQSEFASKLDALSKTFGPSQGSQADTQGQSASDAPRDGQTEQKAQNTAQREQKSPDESGPTQTEEEKKGTQDAQAPQDAKKTYDADNMTQEQKDAALKELGITRDMTNKDMLTGDQWGKVDKTLIDMASKLDSSQREGLTLKVEQSSGGQDAGRYNPDDKSLTIYKDGVDKLNDGYPLEKVVGHEYAHSAKGDLKNAQGEDLYNKASDIYNNAPQWMKDVADPYPSSHMVPKAEKMVVTDQFIKDLKDKGVPDETLKELQKGQSMKDLQDTLFPVFDKLGLQQGDKLADGIMTDGIRDKDPARMTPKEMEEMAEKVPYASKNSAEFQAESGRSMLLSPDEYSNKISAAEQKLKSYDEGSPERTYINKCIEVMRETMDAWKAKMVSPQQ
jgi:hypothetical protein